MKIAAAEALYKTETGAGFSLFTMPAADGKSEAFSIKIPGVVSFLATGDFNGTVQGINDLQAAAEKTYGPGDYTPNVMVSFWTFRLMILSGLLAALVAGWFLIKLRRGGLPGKRAVRVAALLPFLPLLANSFAWLLTEVGRQPWIVYGQMQTADGVSPNVGTLEVGITVVGFTVLYGALAVIEVGLLLKRIRGDMPPAVAAPTDAGDGPMTFAY